MKKIIVLFFSLTLLIGCTNNDIVVKSEQTNEIETDFSLHLKDEGPSMMDTYDPLEPLNRRIYYFNYQFDHYLGLPVSNSYKFFFPSTARTGVKNFFSNLYEPISAINGILILNYKVFFRGIERFLINTTIGIVGLFDIATELNLTSKKVTLNETLAIYGVGTGPYLIIPFLGPSDLRNISSDLVTFVARAPLDPIDVFTGDLGVDIAIKSIEAVDFRSRIPFKYYSLGTPFEYEYIRLLYFMSSDVKIETIKQSR